MAERGTPAGDRAYYTASSDAFAFFPPDLGNDPVYPIGDNATRSVMLFDYFFARFGSDWRYLGDEGETPFARWLRMEQAYHQMGLDDLDLPGEIPARLWQKSGLI